MRRKRGEIGLLDYGLMGVGSALAGYSAGMSIDEQDIAWFFVRWILAGTLFSLAIRWIAQKSWVVKLDSFIYPVGIASAVIFGKDLNGLLPNSGFPISLLAASWLGWMLIVGSFATWRDSTLLFQAIPAIALFGLVGCYDTFRDVVFAFFGFLICLATLFARANSREMLRQAVDSGYFGTAETGGVTDPEEQRERITSGPWKWVAGPEWALASAMVIVFLSLLGAPFIQQSVKGVAGVVRVSAPSIRPPSQPALTTSVSAADTVQVGRGPNTGLTDTQLYAVRGPDQGYWRTAIFDTYTGRGWSSSPQPGGDSSWYRYAIDAITHAKTERFAIEPLRPSKPLPVPGEVLSWEEVGATTQRAAGVWEVVTDRSNTEYRGISVVNANPALMKNAVRNVPSFLANTVSTAGISYQVEQLAKEVSASGTTDAEKARLIQAAIAARVKYNLLAEAVPADQDPVKYFLFSGKEGYCDLFASAMTVMARSIGIPARYVQGYLPDAVNQDTRGREIILDRDYHAWSELYFENVGWVVFDATVGAQQVEGGERGKSLTKTVWYKTAWFRLLLNGMIFAGLGVALWYGFQAVTGYGRPHDPRAGIEGLYARFASQLDRSVGRRRPVGTTPAELVALAKPALGARAAEAEELTQQFVRWLYGPQLPTDEELKALRQAVRSWMQKK